MALDPITAGIGLLDNFIDKFVADKDLAAKLGAQARSAEFQGELQLVVGQLEINREEAKSKNWFVVGARPCVMWVCAMSLFYVSLFEPLARFVAKVMFHYEGEFPVVDTTLTMQLLMGLLGLGTMRTVEKLKGAENNRS